VIEADRDGGHLGASPGGAMIIYESLARYVGQGYYALSMTFDLEHSSTLGFGHSMFLARNADAVFGTDHFTAGSLPASSKRRPTGP
jgi:hypothetical protein